MDRGRIKGKVKDIKGRVKRQAGEWTGDTKTQAEGAQEQVKGEIQNVFGKAKDAARETNKKTVEERQFEREKDVA